MDIMKVSATKRSEQGKGPSRRLRAAGRIPAIAYGKNFTATPLAVDPKALKVALGTAHGRNSVLEVDVEGTKITAMVRMYSHHPVSREILHADFLQIDLKEPIDVGVPFKLVGKAKGIVAGGVLMQVYRELPVRCLPEKIPVFIELDVTELDLGESLKTSQLKLPEGVSVRLPAEQTVAAVVAPDKRGEEEAPAKGAAAVPGAAAAAAPAAGGKPGAAAPAAAAGGAKAAPAKDAKADKKKK
jgi:large subunit ribosomal protein L25